MEGWKGGVEDTSDLFNFIVTLLCGQYDSMNMYAIFVISRICDDKVTYFPSTCVLKSTCLYFPQAHAHIKCFVVSERLCPAGRPLPESSLVM